jgi:predicted small metal-binding protein
MATRRKLACHDIVPDCDFVATAATDEELLARVTDHAAHVHGVKKMSPDLLAKVRDAVRDAD